MNPKIRVYKKDFVGDRWQTKYFVEVVGVHDSNNYFDTFEEAQAKALQYDANMPKNSESFIVVARVGDVCWYANYQQDLVCYRSTTKCYTRDSRRAARYFGYLVLEQSGLTQVV